MDVRANERCPTSHVTYNNSNCAKVLKIPNMATTTKYRFELLYHREKMSERALMVVACKPKKKIFNLQGFSRVMFLRIERKI